MMKGTEEELSKRPGWDEMPLDRREWLKAELAKSPDADWDEEFIDAVIRMNFKPKPPREFWVVSYESLVWDRTILGFVPSILLKRCSLEEASKFWFLSKDDAKAQQTELAALEVQADVYWYSLEDG